MLVHWVFAHPGCMVFREEILTYSLGIRGYKHLFATNATDISYKRHFYGSEVIGLSKRVDFLKFFFIYVINTIKVHPDIDLSRLLRLNNLLITILSCSCTKNLHLCGLFNLNTSKQIRVYFLKKFVK